MKVTSISDFRANAKKYFDAIIDDQDALLITRSDGQTIVAVPLDEYNGLTETEYLLSSPAMRKRLQKSQEDMEKGVYIEKTLEELKQYE